MSPASSLGTDSTGNHTVLEAGKDLQDHLTQHHLVQQDFGLLLCSWQGWRTALIPGRCRWTLSQIPEVLLRGEQDTNPTDLGHFVFNKVCSDWLSLRHSDF